MLLPLLYIKQLMQFIFLDSKHTYLNTEFFFHLPLK